MKRASDDDTPPPPPPTPPRDGELSNSDLIQILRDRFQNNENKIPLLGLCIRESLLAPSITTIIPSPPEPIRVTVRIFCDAIDEIVKMIYRGSSTIDDFASHIKKSILPNLKRLDKYKQHPQTNTPVDQLNFVAYEAVSQPCIFPPTQPVVSATRRAYFEICPSNLILDKQLRLKDILMDNTIHKSMNICIYYF